MAALALSAATFAFESGAALRSRCLLWPDSPMEWELLDKPGNPPSKFTLDSNQAAKLLASAIDKAKSADLPWNTTPLVLKPSPELVKLVRLNQLEATKDNSENT